MGKQFEYLVCQVQQCHVTSVNGDWNGTIPMDPENAQQSLDSCPKVWDYLQWAGAEGWELIAAIDSAGRYQMLYLKR